MMKKIAFIAIVGMVFTISSCKTKGCVDSEAVNFNSNAEQDDGTCNYKPTITLLGEPVINLTLADSYIDAGATAMNKDGSSVTVTDDAYLVSPGFAGEYTITYTASNEFGTVTTTREVNIIMTQDDILGDYAAETPCGLTEFPVNADLTLTAGAGDNDVVIDDFFQLVGGTVTGYINNTEIVFPNQSIAITGGEYIIEGTGTISPTATIITVPFDYENTVPFIGGSGTCTVTFTK